MQQEKSLQKFLFLQATALILFFSWYAPVTNVLWQKIDAMCFDWMTNTLAKRPLMQIFWALANIRFSDLFGAIFMLSFSLIWVFDAPKKVVKFRLIQFVYILVWFELGIVVLKELLFPYILNEYFLRDSPSLVLKSSYLLSESIPWLKVKDSSHWSFPSDHAFIILQWASFMFVFTGYRIGILALLTSIFFILPRLFSGAHWLSDILAGSLPLALIVVSWARYTPVYRICVDTLCTIFKAGADYAKQNTIQNTL